MSANGDTRDTRGAAIEGIGVDKAYGGVSALDDATFRAGRGEVHALVGENGAGKSTMIKVLTGVTRADGGAVRIGGEEVRLRSPEDALRRGVSTVFQELTLLEHMTVAENLLLGREPRRYGLVRRGALTDAGAKVLAEHDVESIDPGELVANLPLAQRQLVEVVHAVLAEPDVLILDEPTSALARREVEWLFDLVRRLRDGGACVIFTSHRWSEVTDLADRITVFRNGTDVGTHDTLDESAAVKLMTGREVSTAYPEPTERPGDEVALTARGLTAPGLRDVSLELRRGEILGVGGLDGQGQRELFAALFGLLPLNAGEIEIGGRTRRLRSPRDAIKAGVAFIPQDRKNDGLLLPMTVKDNLTLAVLPRVSSAGVLRAAIERRRAGEMVDRLDIDARRPSQPVATLSGGNQQKALLGRWLLADSRVLLLYDVTRGVDVATKHDIYELVFELAAAGRSILLYSSDTEEIGHLCHRVVVMREGAIASELDGPGVPAGEIIGAAFREGADV